MLYDLLVGLLLHCSLLERAFLLVCKYVHVMPIFA